MTCPMSREEVWVLETDNEMDGCPRCGESHMAHRSNQDNDHWRGIKDDLRNDGSYPYRSEVGVYWDDPRDIRSEEP